MTRQYSSAIASGFAIACLASVCAAKVGAQEPSPPPARSETLSAGARARYESGAKNFQSGRYEGTIQVLEPLRTSPEFAEGVLYMLEESYRRLGRRAEAQQAFVELSTRFPRSALVHKLMGMAYDQQDEFRSAVAEFEAALKADPKLPEVRFGIGLLHLKLHDDENAKKWLAAELRANACFAPALYYLGELERRSGQSELARDYYAKATGCKPDYADAHLALGNALELQGRHREALAAFEKAATLEPGNSAAHYRLARALEKSGDRTRAEAEFAKARALADLQQRSGTAKREGAEQPALQNFVK